MLELLQNNQPSKAYSITTIIEEGLKLHKLGALESAAELYHLALKKDPDNALALQLTGVIAGQLEQLDLSIALLSKAIEINPKCAEAFNNRGLVLKKSNLFERALSDLDQAILLNPLYVEAFNNRGIVHRELGAYKQAHLDFTKAIQLKSDFVEAYNNRAGLYLSQKLYQKALNDINKALAINSMDPTSNWNKSLHSLALENFRDGWELYEWRWKNLSNIGRPLHTAKPKWSGEKNKRVLIWAEQGIGEEIMISSILFDAIEVCEMLVVKCDKFPSSIIFKDKNHPVDESSYDFHLPMMSLPKLFRNTKKSFTNTKHPYLHCDAQKVKAIRAEILKGQSVKLVGLSWHTDSKIYESKKRNVNLIDLVKLFSGTGTTLVSLQYGDMASIIDFVEKNTGQEIIQYNKIDNKNDIDSLFALILACDQVITIDNATAHFSGALGVETHVLLPTTADWRWGISSNKSYWYNSLTLHRQDQAGNWKAALKSLAYKIKNKRPRI
ncbi:MAG: hypothetical protein EB076_08455 [Flavobacteriia bacterium]|nr:hypothetical protein [Flavobacteriia bacterium]